MPPATDMPQIPPSLRRRLAVVAAATLTIGLSPLVAAGTAHAAFAPALQCPPEQFPAAGAPRSAASTPYQVPFEAELGTSATAANGSEGGYIVVNGSNGGGTGSSTTGALSVVLGPKTAQYTTGTLFGNACGYFSIPSLLGNIPQGTGAPDPGNADYNHNFILHGPPFVSTQDVLADPSAYQATLENQIPVAIEVPGTGVPIAPLSGTGSADGAIGNAIASTVAGNGGLNISFDVSAKATATVDLSSVINLLPTQITSLLPSALLSGLNSLVNQGTSGNGPATCTLAIGNMNLTGYPAADVGPFTNAVHVSTDPAASAAAKAAGATPVTGPISDAAGVAVSTGIIQPPIDPGTTPDVAAPGIGTDPSTLCNPLVAELLNDLFGLPQAGSTQQVAADTFVAPVTFRAYTTQ